MNTLRSHSLVGMLLLACLVGTLRAAEIAYSNWQPCGNSVSVSFAQVSTSTWTWKFRNDSAATISYMDFWYTDNTGRNYDVLPGSLKSGQVWGGWGTFTASSPPTIQIKTIQRGNSSNGSDAGIPSQQQSDDLQALQQQQQVLQQQLDAERQQLQAQYDQQRQELLTKQQSLIEQRQQAAANQHTARAQSYQAAGQTAASTIQGIGQVLLNQMQRDADERQAQREEERAERAQERVEAELREQEEEIKKQQQELEENYRRQTAEINQRMPPAQGLTTTYTAAVRVAAYPAISAPIGAYSYSIGTGPTSVSARKQQPFKPPQRLGDLLSGTSKTASDDQLNTDKGADLNQLNELIFGKLGAQSAAGNSARPKEDLNSIYDSILPASNSAERKASDDNALYDSILSPSPH